MPMANMQQLTLAHSSTLSLKAKLKKLDAVYHITEDVDMRYRIMNAEEEIKLELMRRGEYDKPI